MNRLSLELEIRKRLAGLTSFIQLSGFASLYDSHIVSEFFFKDLLNLIFGYSLENKNTEQRNNVATDLIDTQNRIAIQVTAETSIEKVRDTIRKFEENGLNSDFSRLILLILVNKKTVHASMPETLDNYIFERLDIADIYDAIRQISDIDKIQQIAEFLKKELKLDNDRVLSQEMSTLIDLLQLIDSKNNEISDIDTETEPRPDYKIRERFSDYTEFLIDLYVELNAIYGGTLKRVKETLAFDTLKTRKISIFLKRLSDDYLTEANGNPRRALENLVQYFMQELNLSGFTPVENVIWFFLVDEIYRCNVFPNPEVSHANI